jgi:transcriptional regulator with XRE-family HTH domain
MKTLGAKIRKERKARNLTLRDLASKCGVSTMTLQRIETGTASPSVAVLAQIAQQLLRPIDFFIKDENPNIRIIRKQSAETVVGPKMALKMLAPMGMIDDSIMINVGETKAGLFIDAHTEDGYSFVYLLEGGCILEYDGVKYEAGQGDAIFFNARLPHSVMAVGETHKFIDIFFKGKK